MADREPMATARRESMARYGHQFGPRTWREYMPQKVYDTTTHDPEAEAIQAAVEQIIAIEPYDPDSVRLSLRVKGPGDLHTVLESVGGRFVIPEGLRIEVDSSGNVEVFEDGDS